MGTMNKVKKYWLGMSIGAKTNLFALFVLLAVVLATGLNLYTTRFSVREVNRILNEIARCENAQDAMKEEQEALRGYARAQSDENHARLQTACLETDKAIGDLPFSYEEIGEERYAQAWRIRNSYRNYAAQRESICELLKETGSELAGGLPFEDDEEAVSRLYDVYSMQNYIKEYMQSLSQQTVDYASAVYNRQYPVLQMIPLVLVILSAVLILVAFGLSRLFSGTIVTPIRQMASASRSISGGNLEVAQIQVENRDEVGELVQAFNRMNEVTRQNILTMEENQRLMEQLHKEEMETAEAVKRLESARMDLLQSQIKPHFLFNTLNTISGMAELEDAVKTDSMIRSLSHLFRYNLHTSDQFVSLQQEMDVARDYLYLQQMRFGDRVQYEIRTELQDTQDAAGADSIMVPAFMLQPLVENAVIHGISKKEQGGKIEIYVRLEDNELYVRVRDTGAGIDEDVLAGMKARLEGKPSDAHVGIGLGNLYERIRRLYGDGRMKISSIPGEETVAEITIPAGPVTQPA